MLGLGIFRRPAAAAQIRLLKGELARAIREGRHAAREADAEADRADGLADELEASWRENDRVKFELCDALRQRDQARGLLHDARARIDELVDDARADAERIARLEDDGDRAIARERRTRHRLLSAIRTADLAAWSARSGASEEPR